VEAPADLLRRRNCARGIEPDYRSGSQRYRRDRDVPWQIEAAAIEALEANLEAREADLEPTLAKAQLADVEATDADGEARDADVDELPA